MVNQVREFKLPKILQTHIDRRNRLWTQVRIAYPSYDRAQIEARLEQFGA
jgi:hypothetical protein